jgi:hypothetical protein
MITAMGVRGLKQDGRTGRFRPDEVVTVTVRFRPDDPARPAYEELVKRMGVSGAEVVRQAIMDLFEKQAASSTRAALQEAG